MLGIYAEAFMTATRTEGLREMPSKTRPKGLRIRLRPTRHIDGRKL